MKIVVNSAIWFDNLGHTFNSKKDAVESMSDSETYDRITLDKDGYVCAHIIGEPDCYQKRTNTGGKRHIGFWQITAGN